MFISDNANLRTYDPESGWELFPVPQGPQFERFVLRHPVNSPISFWGERLSLKNTGRRLPDGRPEARTVFLVIQIAELGPPDTADPVLKKLIESALLAYGFVHDGPIGPLEVRYRTT